MTLFLQLARRLRPAAAERILRGGRVRPRHGAPDAHHRARDQGNKRARLVLQITANPPRFIAAMQLGVTITSLAIGALGEPVFAHIFEPIPATIVSFGLAFLLITYLHVVIGELVPKGIALGHAGDDRARPSRRPVRWFFVCLQPLIWVLQQSIGRGPPPARPRAARRGARRPLRSRAEDAALALDRARRARAAGAGDALQGLRLRRQGGRGRDGAAAPGRCALDRPAPRGVPRRRHRLSLHALSGLPRDARQHRRHPARARSLLGPGRPRDRERPRRGDRPRRLHRPRDEGPRGDADRVPPHEPAPGDRRRRVRGDAGHRHARGPARGDRRRDRG